MILFPAIDIREGQCVRLTRGDFATAETVAADWRDAAARFREAGAKWLHMVDLDGSLAGRPVNRAIFLAAAADSGMNIQLGGGIRSRETALDYLENGIGRVILGSVILEQPSLAGELVAAYGAERVAVAIDAKDGRVRSAGWTVEHGRYFTEVADEMTAQGVTAILFTDIAHDGTLAGPSFEQLEELRATTSAFLVASGGIRDLNDLERLAAMGVDGAILGKALYKGTLDLAEAVRRFGDGAAKTEPVGT